MTVLVDDRSLWACTAKRGTGRENELEIFVSLFVAEDAFCNLEQSAEFDDSGYAGSDRCLELLFAGPAEAEGTEPGLVSNAEEIVSFGKGADGTAFAFGHAALRALHKAASPGVWGRVADRAEGCEACGWCEGAACQGESRLQREPIRVFEPRTVIFKQNGFGTANAVASG